MTTRECVLRAKARKYPAGYIWNPESPLATAGIALECDGLKRAIRHHEAILDILRRIEKEEADARREHGCKT